MRLPKIITMLAASCLLTSAQAHERIRVRIGGEVSHQTHRFREFFPDHDWGTYRNGYSYEGYVHGRRNSIYFSNGRFSIWYSEPYARIVYPTWQQPQYMTSYPTAYPTPYRTPYSTQYSTQHSTQYAFLSEDAGRAAIEEFFAQTKVQYIQNVRLKISDGRVKLIDFMVLLNDWTPVEYVSDYNALPVFQRDKQLYDATHYSQYILIPPSTKETLDQKLLNSFRKNNY